MRYPSPRHFYQLTITALVLALLFVVACGGTAPAEPVVVEKEVIREVEKPVIVEKEVIKEVEKQVIVEKEVIKEVEVVKEVVKEVLVEPTVAPVAIGAKPWIEWVKKGKYGGDLNMGMAYETDHWDIHQSCCNRSLYIPRDLYNLLVMYNPEDQTTIIGDLADSWEWAADGNSVTFRLPANAQWTDGTPITADDIVFSLDRMSDLTKIRPRVRNIAPYYENSVALDPQTVQVNTKFSNPAALLPFLATGYMVMLPKHVLDGRADAEEFFDTPENIVGSGAFTFVNHERGSSMKIERNDNYFKEGLPFLDSITAFVISDKNTHMSAFITGQIDFSPGMGLNETDANGFVRKIKDKGKLFYSGANLMRFYQINFNNEPVNDPRVRRALYLALDREEVNRVMRLGKAKLGVPFFPGTQWSSSEEEVATWPGYRYVDGNGTPLTTAPYGVEGVQKDPRDIDMAKALMAEAGHAEGVEIEYHTYALLKEVPVLLKAQFAKIGVDLKIKITDTTTGFNAEQAGDYQHLLGLGHGPNILDPDDLFLGVYMPGGPRNALKYTDQRIIDIFEKQKSEADLGKRIALIREAEEILRTGEGHFHNLYWWPLPAFSVSNRVKNYDVTAITVQYGFQKEHIWLEK